MDLARRLSATPSSIRRIENSIASPESTKDADVALLAAVLFDVDPIQMADQFGFRWSYGEQFEQLRLLNPGWVALVEELNEMKAHLGNWWDAPRSSVDRSDG